MERIAYLLLEERWTLS